MQRPRSILLVHRLLPGFELQTSNVPKQQMKTPANRRTGKVTASNAQHYKLVHRRIGVHRRIDYRQSAYQIPTFNATDWYTGESAYIHRRIDYHQSAYQIPTFNTTDWYTGESAYTGESIIINRRIRFQRSTQQIGTPTNRRTQANRLPLIGVSDSNVQRNRLVHRQISVHTQANRLHQSAYQIPTFNTTDWYTDESAYTGESITINRRIRYQRSIQQIGTPAKRRTGDRWVTVSDSNIQHNRLVHRRSGVPATGDRRPRVAVSDSNVTYTKQIDANWTNFEALMATVRQTLAVNGNSRGWPSLLPTRRVRRPLGPNNFQNCVSQLKTSSLS